MDLWLVRHGQTAWNVEKRVQGRMNIGLNAHGRQQAAMLAQRIANIPFEALYTSDLRRAFQTASIINRHLHLPIRRDQRLRERGFGAAEGLLRSEMETQFSGYIPNAETNSSVQGRANRFLHDISDIHTGRILCVSHGGFIRALLNMLSFPPIDAVDNASITVLQKNQNHWRVMTSNDTQHLQSDADIKTAAYVVPRQPSETMITSRQTQTARPDFEPQ